MLLQKPTLVYILTVYPKPKISMGKLFFFTSLPYHNKIDISYLWTYLYDLLLILDYHKLFWKSRSWLGTGTTMWQGYTS
jgi:hypothetical protein